MDKVIQFISTLLVLTLFAGATPGLAKAAKKKAPKAAVEKADTVQKFGAMSLKGELKRPELDFENEKLGFQQDSNIQIPENFNHEILDGANHFL
jgi:hypothetical protein